MPLLCPVPVLILPLTPQFLQSPNNFRLTQIYAVNSISFHNRYGTFATAGADGSYAFWDKDKRQRLKPPTKL